MPRLNAASGGQNWSVTLDSLSVGKAHIISGEIERNFGFTVSLSVLFRRAINIYHELIISNCSQDNDKGNDIRAEFYEICQAAGRDPDDVIKGLRKKAGRNPLSSDKDMTSKKE